MQCNLRRRTRSKCIKSNTHNAHMRAVMHCTWCRIRWRIKQVCLGARVCGVCVYVAYVLLKHIGKQNFMRLSVNAFSYFVFSSLCEHKWRVLKVKKSTKIYSITRSPLHSSYVEVPVKLLQITNKSVWHELMQLETETTVLVFPAQQISNIQKRKIDDRRKAINERTNKRIDRAKEKKERK